MKRLALVALLAGCHCPPERSAREPAPGADRNSARARALDRARRCAGAAANAISPDLLTFVALGYGDLYDERFRALEFVTEELTTDEAKAVVCLVEEYNAAIAEPVSAAIESFRGQVMHWQFGRANSPVLYAHLPYWTSQREGAPRDGGERITDEEHAATVARLKQAFGEGTEAAEIGPVEHRPRVIRIWWD